MSCAHSGWEALAHVSFHSPTGVKGWRGPGRLCVVFFKPTCLPALPHPLLSQLQRALSSCNTRHNSLRAPHKLPSSTPWPNCWAVLRGCPSFSWSLPRHPAPTLASSLAAFSGYFSLSRCSSARFSLYCNSSSRRGGSSEGGEGSCSLAKQSWVEALRHTRHTLCSSNATINAPQSAWRSPHSLSAGDAPPRAHRHQTGSSCPWRWHAAAVATFNLRLSRSRCCTRPINVSTACNGMHAQLALG